MNRKLRWLLTGGGGLLALGLLLPAAGDWLVTRDGSRIETDGPWRVEDRLIVFKQADGSLSSVRRSEIDLEASERLTRAMDEGARSTGEPAARPEPRRATVRLTEKELPPVGRSESEDEGEPGIGVDDEDPAPAESLQIVSWEETGAGASDGLGFVGEVRNLTERTALAVGVDVALFDERGEEIATVPAALTVTALPPGQSARFRASFPDQFHYVRVEFRSSGTLLDPAPPASSETGLEDEAPPPTGR